MDNSLSEEQKACWEWAKKEPFWSSKVYSKTAFLKLYTSESNALRGQYENWLELNKPAEGKIKKAVPTVWERMGFTTEKEYVDFQFNEQQAKHAKAK